ncbi:MAG: hypothetical protein H6725_03315 [Sandaracinaceae bacterium]|nr:hypothetical protein [Sandaracinaceae bacterium]
MTHDGILRPCSFRLGVEGWALTTHLKAGPVLARARAANALRTESCVFLGPDDEHPPGQPRVRLVQGEARAVFTGADGAHASDGRSRMALGPARHVALASEHRRARLALADGEGIALGDWPALGDDELAVPHALRRTPVSRSDVQVLEMGLSGDRVLVLYGLPDPVLGVLYVGPDDVRDVRLRLPAPVRHVDVEWVGEQVGVALRLDTGQSMGCVLDARGSTRVKPYLLLGGRADGSTPRVLWAERGFKVAVPCASDGSVRVVSMGATGEPELVVEEAAGPMDAVYFAQRYYFAAVHEAEDAATLLLRSVEQDGGGTQTLSCSVWPSQATGRLRLRVLRDRLRGLAAELRGVGYRSTAGQATDVHLDGTTLNVKGPAGDSGAITSAVELRVAVGPEGDALVVRWRAPVAFEEPSFPRVRRVLGIDRPLSPLEEEQLAALRASVPHRQESVEADPRGWEVRFQLTELPDTIRLAGAVRSLLLTGA